MNPKKLEKTKEQIYSICARLLEELYDSKSEHYWNDSGIEEIAKTFGKTTYDVRRWFNPKANEIDQISLADTLILVLLLGCGVKEFFSDLDQSLKARIENLYTEEEEDLDCENQL